MNETSTDLPVAQTLVCKSQLFSKTPVVILTIEEYNELLAKAKENSKLKQLIDALHKLKGIIKDADGMYNELIMEA